MTFPDFSPEFQFQTSRSGGPGGQNVNKVSSKVELRFDVPGSALLTDEQKQRVLKKLRNQITQDGVLLIVSQEHRSQLQNRQAVVRRFYELLERAFREPKPRKPTKPSAAAKAERLRSKRRTSENKARRGGNWTVED
jgi:ribosome-associated protein